jgi:cyanophycin synthetase
MEVSRIRALRGPNLWSKNTAIEAIVSCADAECSIDNLPDFEARLRARLPQTGLLRPEGHQGAVSIAHVLQIVALTMQAHAGCPVTFGRTASTIEPGVFQVVVEYSEEEVGKLAMELAQVLVRAALDDTPFDLADALKRLRELDEDVRLGPSTGSIVNAATARNIPYRRLTQGSMVQFGWGSKQRRIQAAETDLTSAISESIAQDKDLTKMLLDAAGVPVPMGRSVTTAEEAWAAAEELGGPVVVKPRDGSQGRGVAVNIESRERVIQAFEVAEEISSEVIVERYIPGHDFRLLVVGGALVAASRRDPPQVTGDGVQTIRQLVDQVNADLADQDPLRRHCPGDSQEAGFRGRLRAAVRHPDLPAQQRQPEHRRLGHRRDRRSASGNGRARGVGGPHDRAGHLRCGRGRRKRALPA